MGPLAIALLQSLPGLIAAGADITKLVQEGSERVSKAGEPTAQDWEWLNGQIKELQGRLHAPGT
jgi:hypothetical protein